MNVSLAPQLAALIHERVRSVRYPSAIEVARGALRLLEDRGELRRVRRAELRTQVAAGLDALDQVQLQDRDASR